MTAAIVQPLAAVRLRQIIIADLCAAAAGTAVDVAGYIGAWPSQGLLLAIAATVGDCVVLAVAARLVERGRYVHATTLICVGAWATAVVCALLVPFSLPIMVLAVQFPVILAVPYVTRRLLRLFMIITVGCILICAAVARFQNGIGIEAHVPGWVPDVVVAVFVPVMAGLILLIAWHNFTTLQRQLHRQADELAASRARLVAATDSVRRRIERDLHDGAQQHLVALAINLRLAQQLATQEPARCRPLLEDMADQLRAAIAQVRDLAHGIYPPLLTSGGLPQAIPAAAARSPIPTSVNLDGIGRYPPDVEAAVYFCCLEALQNAAKHAGDASASITGHGQPGGMLTITIADTGVGFTPKDTAPGAGLTNMADRLAVIGGTLHVHSKPNHGTRITAQIPTGH
jgi:signal transduction histidine kinase